MKPKLMDFSLFKWPSAILPLIMAFAALILVVGHAMIFGITHELDEGATAHVWQILMVAQLPFVAYFVFRCLPKRPRESLLVLAFLAGLWIANFAAVYWLT